MLTKHRRIENTFFEKNTNVGPLCDLSASLTALIIGGNYFEREIVKMTIKCTEYFIDYRILIFALFFSCGNRKNNWDSRYLRFSSNSKVETLFPVLLFLQFFLIVIYSYSKDPNITLHSSNFTLIKILLTYFFF